MAESIAGVHISFSASTKDAQTQIAELRAKVDDFGKKSRVAMSGAGKAIGATAPVAAVTGKAVQTMGQRFAGAGAGISSATGALQAMGGPSAGPIGTVLSGISSLAVSGFGPLGIAIAGVSVLMVAFANRTDEAADRVKELAKSQKETVESAELYGDRFFALLNGQPHSETDANLAKARAEYKRLGDEIDRIRKIFADIGDPNVRGTKNLPLQAELRGLQSQASVVSAEIRDLVAQQDEEFARTNYEDLLKKREADRLASEKKIAEDAVRNHTAAVTQMVSLDQYEIDRNRQARDEAAEREADLREIAFAEDKRVESELAALTAERHAAAEAAMSMALDLQSLQTGEVADRLKLEHDIDLVRERMAGATDAELEMLRGIVGALELQLGLREKIEETDARNKRQAKFKSDMDGFQRPDAPVALAQRFRDAIVSADEMAFQLGQTLATGVGDALADAIFKARTLREALSDVARSIGSQLISTSTSNLVNLGLSAAFGGGQVPEATNAGKFAHGGSFVVGGSGGIDSQLIAMKTTPGERVTVDPPGKRSGGINVQIINQAPSASVRQERSDDGTLRLLIEEVAASSMSRGGKLARAYEGAYGGVRRGRR